MNDFEDVRALKRFLTKVEKRKRLKRLGRWFVIGGIAFSVISQWTAHTPGQIEQRSYLVERRIDKLPGTRAPTILASTTFFTTPGAGTWSVPADWNNANNSIEAIGGGGGSAPAVDAGHSGAGGGGGAYAKSTNVTLTRSGTAWLNIGSGGGPSSNGSDSWLNGLANSPPTGPSNGVRAKAGLGASGSSQGNGGAASSCIGITVYDGGTGGFGGSIGGGAGGGGGGGAGGPNGSGGAGANIGDPNASVGGCGGGGGGGGAAGNKPTGVLTGGFGGNNYLGSGGGSNNTSGTNGGGGGGADGASTGSSPGGNGGAGTEWDGSHGSGGGGGGAGANSGSGGGGGSGGLYGGGAGGGGSGISAGNSGAQGLVVVIYIPALPPVIPTQSGEDLWITPHPPVLPSQAIRVLSPTNQTPSQNLSFWRQWEVLARHSPELYSQQSFNVFVAPLAVTPSSKLPFLQPPELLRHPPILDTNQSFPGRRPTAFYGTLTEGADILASTILLSDLGNPLFSTTIEAPDTVTGVIIIPITGTADDITARVKALLPKGWFAFTARYRDAVLGGLADLSSWSYSLIGYTRNQMRLATASGPWLDLMSWDFFGVNLLRKPAELDPLYRARIQKELIRERVTRKGMINAMTDLTGRTPVVFEPWNPGDAGAWDVGTFAWDVSGGSGAGGGWGDTVLHSQSFLIVFRPGLQGIANVGGWDTGYAAWDGGFSQWADQSEIAGPVTDTDIYATINRTKPTGSLVWTQLQ